MLSKIGKWYSELFLYKGSQWLSILARTALIVSILVNFYMVIIRKLFPAFGLTMGTGIVGGYEITEVAMVFIVTCALCDTWYTAGHLRLGLVRDRMKERPKAALDTFCAFLAIFLMAIFVWAVFLQAMRFLAIGASTPIMQIPISPFGIIFCIVIAHAFLVFLRSFIGLASKTMGKKFARESYLQGQ